MTFFNSLLNFVTNQGILEFGEKKFSVSAYYDSVITYPTIVECMKNKKKRGVKVIGISTVHQDIIKPYSIQRTISKKGRKLVATVSDRTGVFKVDLLIKGVKNSIIFSRHYLRSDKPDSGYTIAAFQDGPLYDLMDLIQNYRHTLNKPKPGIYNVNTTPFGTVYSKYKGYLPVDLYEDTDFFKDILFDVENYYKSEEKIFNGKPSYPSYLFYGLPGTGKTTLALTLANTLKDKICIFNISNSVQYKDITALCSKYSIPCMVIWEEADNAFGAEFNSAAGSTAKMNNHTLSFIKNTLEGAGMDVNPAGIVRFFITNYPNTIEPTVLRRLGTAVHFGKLSWDNKKEKELLIKTFDLNFKNRKLEFSNFNALYGAIADLKNKWTYSEVSLFLDFVFNQFARDKANIKKNVVFDEILIKEYLNMYRDFNKTFIKFNPEPQSYEF